MDANSPFNPEQFATLTVNESNSTDYVLLPEGEYTAVTSPVTAESFKSFDITRGDNAGKKGVRVEIEWNINDDTGSLKELLGRPPKARLGIMLDLRNDGTIEMGKGRNVQLGRIREAFGQNSNGRPWNFTMLGGQVAKIKVKHTIDQNDNTKTYVNVTEVTKA